MTHAIIFIFTQPNEAQVPLQRLSQSCFSAGAPVQFARYCCSSSWQQIHYSRFAHPEKKIKQSSICYFTKQ
jgi:hypothetical protein